MITERRSKNVVEVKNEDSQQISVWSINSILSNIFSYIDRKGLIEFSTVCKKWNKVINPIIHKTIKLKHSSSGLFGNNGSIDNSGKCNAEVIECISNNAKHAPFVKEFEYSFKLESRRAIEFFQTFRFICNLTIYGCDMSQDQFLGMISPLIQLQELNLSCLKIEKINSERHKEVVQLPSTLKKLKLGSIRLIDNPDLFIQTINSHSSLTELSIQSDYSVVFLELFYKSYPSLVKFEYENHQLKSRQFLINIFDQNPQIATFKLSLQYWNSEYINYISSYLINLEELNLMEYGFGNDDYSDINFKFSQPTKIKKLKVNLSRLSNLSYNSILINCPHLEELDLNGFTRISPLVLVKFLKLSNFANLKKLDINCHILGEGAFDTLLSNFPCLSELKINLPIEWKEVIKSIYEKCVNLQRLEICPPGIINLRERDTFLQEFYESEFFTSSPKSKFTLTHLTLNGFRAVDSKSEYFKNFKSLKSIKYPPQILFGYDINSQEIKIDMNLWQGYRLLKINYLAGYGAEFKKILR